MEIKVASMRNQDYLLEASATNIKVDRSSVLGNPFEMRGEGDRASVIQAYRLWLWRNISTVGGTGVDIDAIAKKFGVVVSGKFKAPTSRQVVDELLRIKLLENVQLLCWCAPKPCHADIIKKAIEWSLK